MEEKNLSVYDLARMSHEADSRMTEKSWKRTIDRARDSDRVPPYTVSRRVAELWARLLDKPADYFVRPQSRTTETQRLRAEIVELRRRLREAGIEYGDS